MERAIPVLVMLVVAIICLPLSEIAFPLFFGGHPAPPLSLRGKVGLVLFLVGLTALVSLAVKP